MKKLLQRLKSKSFWVALSGALVMVFGKFLGMPEAAEIVAQTVAALALVCGVVIAPAEQAAKDKAEEEKESEEEKEK